MESGKVTVFGHDRQRKQLEKLAEQARIPPSIIFAGPPGIGKSLVARELAMTLLCQGEAPMYGGCGVCHPCELAARGTHPDLKIIDCSEKESANVESVRSLLNELSFKPYLGGNRVCVFRDAEQLSNAAGNVLLKSLEEPRPGQYFILIASTTSRFPVPLVSRCQLFHFGVLSREMLLRILDPATREVVSGSPVLYETLLAGGTVDGLRDAAELARGLEEAAVWTDALCQGALEKIGEVVPTFGTDRDAIKQKLSLFRLLVRRRMMVSESLAEQRHWAVVLENTLTAEYAIGERNLAPAGVLTNLLLTVPFTSSDPGGTFLSDYIV